MDMSHGTGDKYLNISYKCKLQILVSKVVIKVFSLIFDVKIKLIIFILAIKFKISRSD